MLRSASLLAGAVALAASATAQNTAQLRPISVDAPIHAGTYHVASGRFIRATGGRLPAGTDGSVDVVYNNNHYTAVFYDINGTSLIVDEGRLPSLSSPTSSSPISFPGLSNSYRINEIQLGYATDSIGDGTARLTLLNQYDSCMSPIGGPPPVLDLIINGLPGTISPGAVTPYTFDIDMTGFEFCMHADGDGSYDDEVTDLFGWSLTMSADSGSAIGPIIGARPGAFAPTGNGTVFQAPGAASGSGLSTFDQWFDLDLQTGAQNCFNEGGYDPTDGDPAFGSFWLVLGADLNVSCASCANGIDDDFEDNDDCGMATPMTAPSTTTGLVVRERSIDPDFYVISVPANTALDVGVIFSHAFADIDIRLFDAGCNNQLDISQSVSDNEFVGYFNCSPAPIDLVVEVYVFGSFGPGCGEYDLELTLDSSCSIDDGLEDNDTCAMAALLPEGFTSNLRITPCDLDYYLITLDNGQTLDVTMTLDPSEADLDLFLFPDDNTCDTPGGLLTQSISTSALEIISWTNSTGQPQSYVMKVDVFSLQQGFHCTGYDLAFARNGGTGLGNKFCTAELNSTGQGAHIFATGSDVVVDNAFTLHTQFLPQGSFGYFLSSMSQVFVPNPGGSQGNFCIGGGPVGRFNANIVNTGMGSTVMLLTDLTAWPQPNGLVVVSPGETWNFQYWYRDANPNAVNNFSDAVEVLFQ